MLKLYNKINFILYLHKFILFQYPPLLPRFSTKGATATASIVPNLKTLIRPWSCQFFSEKKYSSDAESLDALCGFIFQQTRLFN